MCVMVRILAFSSPILVAVLGCVCRCGAPLVPRQSWLGCALCVRVVGFGFRLRPSIPGWGVGLWVFVCPLSLHPASPGWGVPCGCLCLGAGFSCAPGFLAGVLGSVWWGAHFALTPALLARVLGRVCLCARSACTLPVLARVCGVDVCASGRVSAAPCHSCLECSGVCVCVHALPVPRQSWLWLVVCVSGFTFWHSPHQSWLRCWGVCVRVPAPLVPRQSLLGFAMWVRVLGFWFRLRPTIPGWDVGMCVCLCARSACTPPKLAGFCHACIRVRVLGFTPAILPGVCGAGVCA